MDRAWTESSIDDLAHKPTKGTPWTMKAKLAPGSLYAALIIALSAWILHGFVEALLAACVTAIASWPLYRRFAARLPLAHGAQRGRL